MYDDIALGRIRIEPELERVRVASCMSLAVGGIFADAPGLPLAAMSISSDDPHRHEVPYRTEQERYEYLGTRGTVAPTGRAEVPSHGQPRSRGTRPPDGNIPIAPSPMTCSGDGGEGEVLGAPSAPHWHCRASVSRSAWRPPARNGQTALSIDVETCRGMMYV